MTGRVLAPLLMLLLVDGCRPSEDPSSPAPARGWVVELTVSVPIPGRIGGAPIGMPSRPADLPEHFDERAIRVRRLEVRPIASGQRTVFGISEIDLRGKGPDRELFFGYLDAGEDGASMICRMKDDDRSVHEEVMRRGMSFPLTCSRPPDLGFRDESVKDGYWLGAGRGVICRKERTRAGLRVHAECFQFDELPDWATAARKVAGEIKVLSAEECEKARNDPTCRLLFTEIQEWTDTGTVWDSMERKDVHGNVVLRGRRR